MGEWLDKKAREGEKPSVSIATWSWLQRPTSEIGGQKKAKKSQKEPNESGKGFHRREGGQMLIKGNARKRVWFVWNRESVATPPAKWAMKTMEYFLR